MSRSRRKVPKRTGADSRRNGTLQKRLASKAVRNYKGEIPNGRGYKKIYCSYNICDYRWSEWDKNSKWYEIIMRK